MKQITVAVIATMVLLISDKQQANFYAYSNKKVDETAAMNSQPNTKAGEPIQRDCIDGGELLHEALFLHF